MKIEDMKTANDLTLKRAKLIDGLEILKTTRTTGFTINVVGNTNAAGSPSQICTLLSVEGTYADSVAAAMLHELAMVDKELLAIGVVLPK